MMRAELFPPQLPKGNTGLDTTKPSRTKMRGCLLRWHFRSLLLTGNFLGCQNYLDFLWSFLQTLVLGGFPWLSVVPISKWRRWLSTESWNRLWKKGEEKQLKIRVPTWTVTPFFILYILIHCPVPISHRCPPSVQYNWLVSSHLRNRSNLTKNNNLMVAWIQKHNEHAFYCCSHGVPTAYTSCQLNSCCVELVLYMCRNKQSFVLLLHFFQTLQMTFQAAVCFPRTADFLVPSFRNHLSCHLGWESN